MLFFLSFFFHRHVLKKSPLCKLHKPETLAPEASGMRLAEVAASVAPSSRDFLVEAQSSS